MKKFMFIMMMLLGFVATSSSVYAKSASVPYRWICSKTVSSDLQSDVKKCSTIILGICNPVIQ